MPASCIVGEGCHQFQVTSASKEHAFIVHGLIFSDKGNRQSDNIVQQTFTKKYTLVLQY